MTEILSDSSMGNNPGRRPKIVREKVIDNLPENVTATAEFSGMDDLSSDSYSGREEVEAAYETWFADYDVENTLMTCDMYQSNSGGRFEIRLEEIDELRTSEWRGPHHLDRRHTRDSYGEVGGYESIKSVKTGDTIAVLEGEYDRTV